LFVKKKDVSAQKKLTKSQDLVFYRNAPKAVQGWTITPGWGMKKVQ